MNDRHNGVLTEADETALRNYHLRTQGETVEERLDRIEKMVGELDTKLSTILATVDNIMEQAGPVIKQIAESPMVKMLTGGK